MGCYVAFSGAPAAWLVFYYFPSDECGAHGKMKSSDVPSFGAKLSADGATAVLLIVRVERLKRMELEAADWHPFERQPLTRLYHFAIIP